MAVEPTQGGGPLLICQPVVDVSSTLGDVAGMVDCEGVDPTLPLEIGVAGAITAVEPSDNPSLRHEPTIVVANETGHVSCGVGRVDPPDT